MSDVLQETRAALEAAASAALTSAPVSLPAGSIAWPNVAFTPPDAPAPHARVDVLMGRTSPETAGVGGLTRRPGILQVLLYRPLGEGLGTSLAHAQAVLDAMKRGTRLASGATSVLVQRASVGPAYADGAWSVLPVTIDWLVLKED